MDPWCSVIESDCEKESGNHFSRTFEDNFKPTVSDTLPDSQHYLQTLENKLQKIRNDTDIITQLQNKREACIFELLNGDTNFEQDSDILDTPLNSSSFLRAVAPEKQALTTGEVVELIKYDRLNTEEDSDHSDTASR